MCCLWWSIPSVLLVVGVGWCATVPAVRVWNGLPVAAGMCCLWMVSLWGVWPVVSTLDTLPACEGVGCAACGGQFPRWCWLSVSDGVPQFQR